MNTLQELITIADGALWTFLGLAAALVALLIIVRKTEP